MTLNIDQFDNVSPFDSHVPKTILSHKYFIPRSQIDCIEIEYSDIALPNGNDLEWLTVSVVCINS